MGYPCRTLTTERMVVAWKALDKTAPAATIAAESNRCVIETLNRQRSKMT